MSDLRVGVLGASKIAGRSTVPAMTAVDGVVPVTVAARDSARAAAFAHEHGLRVSESYDAVVTDPDVDVVYVPLPNGLHYEWVRRALLAGKHVLSEKSLTGSLERSRELIELARTRQLVLVENFMCETHPQHAVAQSLVAEGQLGALRHLDLAFGFPPFPADDQRNSAQLDGGALNDAGAYCAFMARHYAGRMPVSVSTIADQGSYDVDVIGSTHLDFGGGLTASLTYGFQHDYRNELRLWGSGGQLLIDRAFSIPKDRTPSVTLTSNTVASAIEVEPADQFDLQIKRFRDLVTSRDGVEAEYSKLLEHAATMEAMRVSGRSGGARVRPDELLGDRA